MGFHWVRSRQLSQINLNQMKTARIYALRGSNILLYFDAKLLKVVMHVIKQASQLKIKTWLKFKYELSSALFFVNYVIL